MSLSRILLRRFSMSSHRPKVFISRDDFPASGIELLKNRCDVDIWPTQNLGDVPREEFLKKIAGKDGILIYPGNRIDAEVLSAAGPSLKVISSMSVGVDHIDLNAIRNSSVKLGNTPGVLTESVAELTVALILAVNRRILEAYKAIVNNEWKWTPTWMCGRGLSGSTVGIVGFGRIGQAVARKLISFDVGKILYSGPRKKTGIQTYGAEFVEFEVLLKESDVIIVLCPLTPETKGIFTSEKFALMKPNAIFINTARGGIVDQDALVYALKNKVIRGAGLDVMTPEPLPHDHPLVGLNTCVLTPHIGSATVETRDQMCYLAVENLLAVLYGNKMPAEYIP